MRFAFGAFFGFFGRFLLFFVGLRGVAQFGAFEFGFFAGFAGLFRAFLLCFFVFGAVFREFFGRPFAAFGFDLGDQFVRLFSRDLAAVDRRFFPRRAAAEHERAEQRGQRWGQAATELTHEVSSTAERGGLSARRSFAPALRRGLGRMSRVRRSRSRAGVDSETVRGPRQAVVIAVLAAAAALFAASALGTAAAEAPTGAAVARTISVDGVAVAPIPARANAAAANTVYREAMAKAVLDGQGKATFLAERTGATVGAVDSVIEQGGYIECSDGTDEYAAYEGEQPDFGTAPSPNVTATPLSAAAAPGRPSSTVSHRPKVKHRRPTAKKASLPSCNLTAEVALVYAIG